MKASPLQIPGKSIKPPDPASKYRCPHCNRTFVFPKQVVNPRTNKVILVCPYCNRQL